MNVTDPAFHLISPASPIYQVIHPTTQTEQPSSAPKPMTTEDRLFFEWSILIGGVVFVLICLALHWSSKHENY